MVGQTLSHYKVLEEIGRGGMGIVYKALDLKLNREVALKVLPPELVSDPDRKRRFVQEAQAAAALKHPNIAVVYEIDEADDKTFIAMELVEGEKLSDVLKSERLPLARSLELALEIAEGVSEAHEHGIVHRDLKPANIMVTRKGHAKIIDFGLAKLLVPLAGNADSVETAIRRETGPGTIMGTLAYMSPEQARGQPVDHRTDIFAFGSVLFEMIVGRPPFERETPADTLSAILNEPVPPVTTAGDSPRRPELFQLHHLLEKCLAKDPSSRFEKASELADSLRALLVSDRIPAPAKLTRTASLVLGVLLVAAVLGVGIWNLRQDTSDVTPESVSVLIADFDNQTDDPVFQGALEQTLAISLEGASFITSYDRTRARQQALKLDPESEGRLDERITQLVCRSQGIQVAIAGTIAPEGDDYLINVTGLDPSTLDTLFQASVTADTKADIFRASDVLAGDIRSALGESDPSSTLAFAQETFTTASLEAMNAYVRAQELARDGSDDDAIEEYRRAISFDPEFGRAYAGLGSVYANLGEPEEARNQLEIALSKIHRMTARERLRTRGLYYAFVRNNEKAIEELTTLVEQYPSDIAGLSNLALAHFFDRNIALALEVSRRALEIYPSDPLMRSNHTLYAMYAGEFDEAMARARAGIELDPLGDNNYVALALSELALGRLEASSDAYLSLKALGPRDASTAAMGLADLALYQGLRADAKDLLDEGIAEDRKQGFDSAAARKLIVEASIHLADGDIPGALQALERALADSQEVSVVFPVGLVYLGANDSSRAQAMALELGDRLEREPRAHGKLLEGEVLLAQGDARGAIDSFLEARARADTWLGRLALGRAYVEAGAFVEASSELETCLRRRGEATAVFLDDVPTYRLLPPVYYYLGRAQEGLQSEGASESYRTFVRIRERGEDDSLVTDARRRLAELEQR